MLFKRRQRQSWGEAVRYFMHPKGGFRRSFRYVAYRMKRLPDTPQRIARGTTIGFIIGLLPLFGLQFVTAGLLSKLFRGNIIAAILATFVSNPLTLPVIIMGSLGFGHWLLGIQASLSPHAVVFAFYQAGHDLYENIWALWGYGDAKWTGLAFFMKTIFVPSFIGALIPGVILSPLVYLATLWSVTAYRKVRRLKRRAKRSKIAS